MVWQDFWLANPVDGPNPDDNAMFLANAEDFILRIRNHPSVGLYVGRNEGFPPEPIEGELKRLTASLHPGLHYIPSSADGPVSGHGPYRTEFPKFYFEQRATTKLHSEIGMPNVVTLDSLKQMMRPAEMWPHGRCLGHSRFHLYRRAGRRRLARHDREDLRRRHRARRNSSSFPSSSTTTATAPCSRRRARTAWACCCG